MLADERKPPEDIAAQTYGRSNEIERNWLAQQMKDWERTNKVTIVPAGVSKDTPPISKEKNRENAQAGRDKYNKEQRAASGHQNIFTDQYGGHLVSVSRTYIGTFKDINEAIEARDKHRAKVGLKKADY